jgi:hypothetical protein
MFKRKFVEVVGLKVKAHQRGKKRSCNAHTSSRKEKEREQTRNVAPYLLCYNNAEE